MKKNVINKQIIYSKCFSNIALIKYWGKSKYQIPKNPSISFTLKKSQTKSILEFKKSNNFNVEVFLDKQYNLSWSKKITNYFLNIKSFLPFLTNYSYKINTHNTFPYSAGIASSASGFGAISKLLIQMQKKIFPKKKINNELQKTSLLARIGSGSAARSIYKGLVIWGKCRKIPGSSNKYAIKYPLTINKIFQSYYDAILLIDEKDKKISSSQGHTLMNTNPYAKIRFNEAKKNLKQLISILKYGDLNEFIKIVEKEALSLHAMMMLSSPGYILLKEKTIICIEKIINFRKKQYLPISFTLDAGPNIHILYPKKNKIPIEKFIKNELIQYTSHGNCIFDKVNF